MPMGSVSACIGGISLDGQMLFCQSTTQSCSSKDAFGMRIIAKSNASQALEASFGNPSSR